MAKLLILVFSVLAVFVFLSCSDNGTDSDFAWEVVWNRTLTDSTATAFVDLQMAVNGNILALAQTRDGDGNPYYAVVMEIDTAGNIVDTIKIQDNYVGESVFPRAFAIASDNSFLIAGGIDQGDAQLLAVRASANGTLLSDTAFGGTGNEYALDLVETTDNGFAIAGWTASDIATSAAYYLCRFNQAGEVQWTESYEKGFSATGRGLAENPNNGFVLVGDASESAGGDDFIYLVNTDANGDTVWTRSLGGSGNDLGIDIIAVADGYVVSGWTGSLGAGQYDLYLGKVDFDGNLDWEDGFGSSANESYRSISETADGGFLLTGMVSGQTGGDDTAYLVKISASGSKIWDLFLQEEMSIIIGAYEIDPNTVLLLSEIEHLDGSISSYLMKIELSGV